MCETSHAAQKARSINNANVLTLGGFITTPQVAQEIVNTWLDTEFSQEWESAIQEWLHHSMHEIAALESQTFKGAAE